MKAADTRRFVLDASVALAWCFEDETTEFTEGVLELLADGAEAVVPAIWPFEIANALLVGERRKRIAPAKITLLLRRVASLPISVMPIDAKTAFGRIFSVARLHGLTEYDAAYLELAIWQQLPLATLDEHLRKCARANGTGLMAV